MPICGVTTAVLQAFCQSGGASCPQQHNTPHHCIVYRKGWNEAGSWGSSCSWAAPAYITFVPGKDNRLITSNLPPGLPGHILPCLHCPNYSLWTSLFSKFSMMHWRSRWKQSQASTVLSRAGQAAATLTDLVELLPGSALASTVIANPLPNACHKASPAVG